MPAPLLSRTINEYPFQTILRQRVDLESVAEFCATQRRRIGAIVMAIIAIALLAFRRAAYDGTMVLIVESVLCAALIAIAAFAAQRIATKSAAASDSHCVVVFVTIAIVLPWVADRFARRFGFGNGVEIVMLSSLAWGGLSASVVGQRSRTISLSVVCSGFLTLFTIFISDTASASLFAYAWASICLWWLLANHWEQVESCTATHVKRTGLQRVVVVICKVQLNNSIPGHR